MDSAAISRDLALVEHDPAGLDATYPSPPNDPLDLLEALVLSRVDDCAAEHRRLDGRIEAKELAARLEPAEEIVDILGVGEGLQHQ